MNILNAVFTRIVLFFWGIWWFIAFLTDVFDGLKSLGYSAFAWTPSKNFYFLHKSLAIYHMPMIGSVILYVLIICGSLTATLLFFYAFHSPAKLKLPFMFSLIFWMCFLLGDQIIMNFTEEANHMVQANFELLSFILLLYLNRERHVIQT